MLQWYSLLAPNTASSSATSVLERASRWFLNSGIQEASGGIARYHLSDSGVNVPVSNEITGYGASFLAWTFEQTGAQEFLDAAIRAGRFLTRTAWDEQSATFPFEPVSD